MRTLTACAVALLTAACGSESGPHTPLSPSGSGRAPVTLRVMTFNIQHGIDGTDHYNLQRAIDTIAAVRPDIVGLQEVTRNHPYYNCDDQPARIAAGVNAATGMSWTISYQQEWFTPDVSCQQSGRGDGPETEGLAVLTHRMVSNPTMTALPDSRIGLEVAIRDAYNLPFVVTHLTSGAAGAGVRMQQVDRLTSWAAQFGEPRVIVGDFNATPDSPEIQKLLGYHDAWNDAVKLGQAIGAATSHGTSRIDYVFYAPGTSLTLQSAETVNTVALIGLQASDHAPFLATFTVR
jgi:endonuclease/exonuclease/phosphatase family metal-dependent hydrolase